MFIGKFITIPEFAFLEPIDVFHREWTHGSGRPHPEELRNLHITFRGTFAGQTAGRVVVRWTADDYCKLYVNGRFASQGPAQGYYFDYNYCETDITDMLADGENTIDADVYYQGLINRAYDSGDLRCGFICDVIADGTTVFSTDESWRCRFDRSYTGRRTTGYETQYLEDRDLRLKPTEWGRVRVREHDYTFAEKPFPALDVYTLEPVGSVSRVIAGEENTDDVPSQESAEITTAEESAAETAAGSDTLTDPSGSDDIAETAPEKRPDTKRSVIYDFGKELVGSPDIVIRGHDGDKVVIRAAEELANGAEGVLDPDTEIRYKTRANCVYDEEVILAEGENHITQYDYKAFRYTELIFPEDDELMTVTATARNHPFDENACVLDTSDKVLSDVFGICKHGVKLGSQEVYVDCPGREKGQYAGDLTITSASQMWLTGSTDLFVKAVRNQCESAFIDDGLMAVTPGSYMQEIADYSLQFPILALRYYDFTGDRAGLVKLIGVCDKLLTSFERFQRDDGLLEGVDKWNLVDWPSNLRDDYDFELTNPIGKGVHNVINAFYIGAVICTEKLISLAGIDLDNSVDGSARRSDALIEAYERAFWRPEQMLYADSETSGHASLHSNVLPLYFGFARTEAHPHIADLIRRRGFSSGVYMSYFTMKALARVGLYSDIWNMITSVGENSWYNMVREGNTACIEAWGKDKKWNTSLCHPWASAPVSVLIEDLVGISPREPGFKDISVHPHLPKSLAKLDMRVPLPDGRHVEFEWDKGFYNWRLLK